MHLVLHVRVLLHQGFHVNPTSLHSHGLCCRMSDRQPTVDEMSDVGNPVAPDSSANAPNTDASRLGPQTSRRTATNAMANAAAAAASACSQGVQPVAATIDCRCLETAISRMNDGSASNLKKGTKPKWDFQTETFVDWQHKAEIWEESRDTRHLLERPPIAAPAHLCQHDHEIAKHIIMLALPHHDRAFVRGSQTLHEIWASYWPST